MSPLAGKRCAAHAHIDIGSARVVVHERAAGFAERGENVQARRGRASERVHSVLHVLGGGQASQQRLHTREFACTNRRLERCRLSARRAQTRAALNQQANQTRGTALRRDLQHRLLLKKRALDQQCANSAELG